MISGRRWIKVSPNNAPAEKLIKYMRIVFNLFAFIERVIRPMKEIRLTKSTLVIE